MKRNPAQFDHYHWKWQTGRSREIFSDLIKRAEKAQNDSEKDVRLSKQLCISCHYILGRIGGAAMTQQPCACCLEGQWYGSTVTDELCLDCAKKHNLCKRCGGDIDMRQGRRKWPEPRAKEQQE